MIEPKWLPWQQKVLDDIRKHDGEYVVQAPRQNGKSEALLWEAMLTAMADKGRVLYVSHDVRMSRHNMERIRAWLSGHEDIYRPRMANGQEQIEFRDGGRIYFRSFRQRGGRGLQCDDVFVDDCDGMTVEQRYTVLASAIPKRVVYGCVLPQAQSPLHRIADGVFYCYDGPDTYSHKAYLTANPSAEHLVKWEWVERELETLTEDYYRRSRLATGPFRPGYHDPERVRVLK